ncbi:MAG: ATP-binding protein [Candidatus Nanohaloarchaea archaeon]|nr:ATP-binding protein [Candidatus Nanohaloarchaea archaeon]
MEVGTVEGAVNTEKFSFEAHRDIEKFDFVTVKSNTDEAEWLLAQISEVEKKPLDDGGASETYKTVAEADIVGYRVNGLLKKPRSVIEPDSVVYRADQDIISKTLGLDQSGLYMGVLVTDNDIKIFIDPEELYKHFAVLAKTGAGKSYSTSCIIEEMLDKNYPVIVIDPHGEYSTLSMPNSISGEQKKKYDISARGYDVREFSPNTELNQDAEKLSFTSENMDSKEIQQVTPTNLTNSQLGVLYTALKDLKSQDTYYLEDVIDSCTKQESKAKWNLINILETVQDSGLFSEKATDLEDLVEPGRATVINLRGVDPELQETTVFKLSKELFEMRKRGELEPFFMILEEAHNFVPEKGMGKAVCSDILRKIASEGRKFGLGIGVVSQRPANVAKNVLSQCGTQLIMRVTNPNDLKAISRSFEGVNKSVKNSITGLPPGTGLVLGKEYPIMTDIRVRKSLHGGGTKQVSEAGEEELEGSEEELNEPDREVEGSEEVSEEIEETSEPEEEQETVDTTAVDVFSESMDRGALEERLGEVERTFYPVWIVESGVGRFLVDGKNGDVKEKDLNLAEDAETVLEVVKTGEVSREDLVSSTDLGEDRVDQIVGVLKDQDVIEETSSGLRYAESGIFDRRIEHRQVPESEVMEAQVSEDEARSKVQEKFDTKVKSAEKVYKLYFVSGDRVFDSVTGEEV